MVAAPSTRERLLSAAIEQIEFGGEQALRLHDIALASGVAAPSIYHFFGSRDGLIEAAQAVRYASSLTGLSAIFVERVKSISSRHEFVALMRAMLAEALAEDRVEKRSTRIEVLGSSRTRPALDQKLQLVHRQVVDQLAKVAIVAQRHGWCRRELDPEVIAAWVLTMIDARYLVEMDPEHGDLSGWNAIAIDAVLAVTGNSPAELTAWQSARPAPRQAGRRRGTCSVDTEESRSAVPADGPVVEQYQVRATSDTRSRLLKAAFEQVAAGGEQALRIREVAAAAGVTQPSVYHFFGSREGLLLEVHAERYSSTQRVFLGSFGSSVFACRNQREFVTVIRRHLELANRPERVAARVGRLEVLGSTLSRPALAERIVAEQRELNGILARPLRWAQEAGWLRPDIDTYMFAAWALGQTLAREMMPGRPDRAVPQWGEMMIEGVLASSGNPSQSLVRDCAR